MTALAASGHVALAGTAAGLFRRGPAGRWQRLDLPATEVQAIAFGDSPDVLAVGAGSAIDVSRNAGKSWTRAEVDSAGRVTALGIADASMLAGTDRDGIFRSTSGGASWQPFGLQGQMVLAVAGDSMAGTDQGLWVRDTATGWRKLKLDAVVTALFRDGQVIVAGTEEQGLFRSADGGETWQRCPGVDEGINALTGTGQRIVAGTSVGHMFQSDDGGTSWRELPGLPMATMAVALDGDAVLAGSYRMGLFRLEHDQWQSDNAGLESTNAIDLVAAREGLLVIAMDGLQRLSGSEWQPLVAGVSGDPRAATLAHDGRLLLGTTDGLFADGVKLGELKDVSLIRSAPNGDLAVLTEDALHVRLGEKWTQTPRSDRERTIDVVFSPSYPDDDGLLLCTLRQGTRCSVVRFGPKSQQVDRLFDYDARSRWVSVALPPDYRVDTRRPAGFFAGTGGSLFRPAWPGDAWQRDIIHDPNAIVLSVTLSPSFPSDKTVMVGTTAGAVATHNAGLLWTKMDDGLDDRRCLKMVYDETGRLFCLTPTRVYELTE